MIWTEPIYLFGIRTYFIAHITPNHYTWANVQWKNNTQTHTITSVYVLITYLDSHILLYRRPRISTIQYSHVLNGMPFAISYRPYQINETQSFPLQILSSPPLPLLLFSSLLVNNKQWAWYKFYHVTEFIPHNLLWLIEKASYFNARKNVCEKVYIRMEKKHEQHLHNIWLAMYVCSECLNNDSLCNYTSNTPVRNKPKQ